MSPEDIKKSANSMELRKETKLSKILHELVPEAAEDASFIVTLPATRNPTVAGSMPLGTCRKCGQTTWVSPSSQDLLHACVVICADCIANKLQDDVNGTNSSTN